MIRAFIGALIGVIIAYLGASFAMWDLNAGNWGQVDRWTTVGVMAFLAPVLAFIGAATGDMR